MVMITGGSVNNDEDEIMNDVSDHEKKRDRKGMNDDVYAA